MRVRKTKRGIFSTIITDFIGLVFEGISSFLHNRRHKALHKAVKAMSVTTDMQRNKLMYLENTMVMYGIYTAETLENLVKTVHTLHSRQALYKIYSQARPQQPMNLIYKCIVCCI